VAASSHPLDEPGRDSASIEVPYRYHSVTFEELAADSTCAYHGKERGHENTIPYDRP